MGKQKMYYSNDGDKLHTPTFLNPRQVAMIEEALSALGEFGEVRLIVEKGRLRFLITQKSIDALKWQPGHLIEDV